MSQDAFQQPTGRAYKDRLGRTITDPETIEARRLQEALRRCISRGIKAGRRCDQAVTVGELAASARLTPARVVEVIREFDVWLWGMTEEGPLESWWVWEDGE